MSLEAEHEAVKVVVTQRCFYLFAALLLLLISVPFLEGTPRGLVTLLTSTGFGDITPLTRQARGLCMIEQITGALFVAILIARLAGVYPPRESYVDDRVP